jgi:hypothetical protein
MLRQPIQRPIDIDDHVFINAALREDLANLSSSLKSRLLLGNVTKPIKN